MRRKLLVGIALTLAVGNVAYFVWLASSSAHEVHEAKWLAYMPELEAYQRTNPDHWITSSHHRDPRYPLLNEGSGPEGVSLLSKVAGVCRVGSYEIRQKPVSLQQMPDRLFLGELSADQARCVRTNLPAGYELHELQDRVKPSDFDWSDDPASHLKSKA